MARPRWEVADIFRRQGPSYRAAHALPRSCLRVMRAIEVCRTAALGGHVEQCPRCAQTKISYNSCRNRHCPKCQGAERRRWVERRTAELLPVPYYHVVFTLPEGVAEVARENQSVVYAMLFRTAAETLRTIARDPRHLGAEIGFFAVLHTWGQNLLHHPHVHCVVPGGGLSPDRRRWIGCRPGFFLSVRVLSRLYRRLFLASLEEARAAGELRGALAGDERAWARAARQWRAVEWVVYARPPFGGPQQVLAYLGRYTHRVAIANERLLAVTDTHVTFQWKDYRRGAGRTKSRVMTVEAAEFVRRFLLHVLPPGFPRIRYFGLCANRKRTELLAQCRAVLGNEATALLPTPEQARDLRDALIVPALRTCPHCGAPLVSIGILPAYRWPQQPPDSS